MREYGVIPTSFWSDPAYSNLSPEARLMMIYLISCIHTNMLGCFRLPEEYIAADLNGFDQKKIQKTLHELIAADLISVDFKFNWILIHPFLDWNPIANPNQAKCITKIFEKVSPSISIYEKLVEIVLLHAEKLSEGVKNRLTMLMEGFRNRSETVSKGFRNQNQKQEQKQNQKQDQNQKQSNGVKPTFVETLSKPLIEIPLNTGELFPVSPEQVEQWKALYPAIDVMQELRNLLGWNLANPQKRKTKNGILKHLNSWFSKAQNKPSYYQTRSPPLAHSLFERNKIVAEQWLRESEAREISVINEKSEKNEKIEKIEIIDGEINDETGT